MYYESIPQEIRKTSSAFEAAELARSGKVHANVALEWISKNGTFLAISDVHVDDPPFAETAILKKTDNGYIQVESITVAWINSLKETQLSFERSENSLLSIPANPIIGKPTNQSAWFTCGCCGEGFKDVVKEQLKFDQDQGFGICKPCQHYH
jgi:hypothetical protein